MKINQITSSSNSVLKLVRALHQRSGREKHGQFLVEGPKPIAEALRKGVKIDHIVVSETYYKQDPTVVASANLSVLNLAEDKLFKELATTSTPAGIIAVASMPRVEPRQLFKSDNPLIVVAHALQDPGNVGTIARTALAAGVSGLILTKGTVDPFNPKVVRAASGALFSLPLVWDVPLADAIALLCEKGVRTVGCDQVATSHYFDADLSGPLALVVANEGNGFSPDEVELLDATVSIPMAPDSESLNASVALSIILYSAVESRMKKRITTNQG